VRFTTKKQVIGEQIGGGLSNSNFNLFKGCEFFSLFNFKYINSMTLYKTKPKIYSFSSLTSNDTSGIIKQTFYTKNIYNITN
jgi:hypothetical protein